ncbi:MAG TPA: helix-turn-helix transcriptional regulator [Ktedonobacterales bacterium]|nr:helix-turn-helix transcriptional regulator [Ktedonobacterales bacterium]
MANAGAESQEPRKKPFWLLRQERGLRVEQIAADLGVAYNTILNIDKGRNKPRVELAERLYVYFGVPLGSIDWGVPRPSHESPKSVD